MTSDDFEKSYISFANISVENVPSNLTYSFTDETDI